MGFTRDFTVYFRRSQPAKQYFALHQDSTFLISLRKFGSEQSIQFTFGIPLHHQKTQDLREKIPNVLGVEKSLTVPLYDIYTLLEQLPKILPPRPETPPVPIFERNFLAPWNSSITLIGQDQPLLSSPVKWTKLTMTVDPILYLHRQAGSRIKKAHRVVVFML